MDLGFGPDVNKLFKKARKSAREARERKYADKERQRQHETGMETLRGDYGLRQLGLSNAGALERAKTEGIIGLARQGLSNRGQMERLQYRERPGGIQERQVKIGEKEQERLQEQGKSEQELKLLDLYQQGTIPKALTDEQGYVVGYQEVGPSAGLTYGQYRGDYQNTVGGQKGKPTTLSPKRQAELAAGNRPLQDFSNEELSSYLNTLRSGQQGQPVKKKVKPQMSISSRREEEED